MMNVVDYSFFHFFLFIKDFRLRMASGGLGEANVACLSWNLDSNRLLSGLQNKSIQIWSYNSDILNSSTLDCTLTSSCSSATSSSSSNNNKKHSISIRALSEENLDDSVKFSLSDDHEPLIADKKKPEAIFKKIWEKM